MKRIPVTQAEVARLNLRLFEGFPYLVTRVVPTLYHVILLPAELPLEELKEIAQWQVLANQLETCLVLGIDHGIFLFPGGKVYDGHAIPRGGLLTSGELVACKEFQPTAECTRRAKLLQEHIERQDNDVWLRGDPTKGGRPPTEDETQRLAGRQGSGVPKGLEPCESCGEWHGECLDPNTQGQSYGLLVTVHCRCQNDSRCARCGESLDEQKVNANYYNPKDGHIWHVPGFCGFRHRCQ